MTPRADGLLQELADEARLLASWRDAHGREQHVSPETLRSVLTALELPCGSEAECRESLAQLRAETDSKQSSALVIASAGSPVVIRRSGSPHYRLNLEDGKVIMGTARDLDGDRVAIHGLTRPGYHTLEMGGIHTVLAIIPRAAPSVKDVAGRERAWVVGAQVYSLQRAPYGNAAVAGTDRVLPGWEAGGDYSAVAKLARQAASHGAAGLAISPVHALFSADPERFSPYAPSSRLFLNALHADPVAVLGDRMPAIGASGPVPALLDAQGHLHWPAIHAQRLAVLRQIYEHLPREAQGGVFAELDTFIKEGAGALADHMRYEALHTHHAQVLGPSHGWQDWPAEFHDPAGPAVAEFARTHADEVRFHGFLQWLASRNLEQAQAAARDAGMSIGLVADMAIGTDPRGSHAWCRQGQMMSGVSVGAPPDIFQPQGQNWGLSAFSPRALRLNGYTGFVETLRAVLAHAGGVRVDHILGLARMWLVPEGASPQSGVYLRYPRDELLDLLALEAWRHRTVVVGENLGTVPEDFNEALSKRGVLGMNVLWFEQEEESGQPVFHAPPMWPSQSMAMVTTHDLPTFCGWWHGRDIEWQERLDTLDSQEAADRRSQRSREKTALWRALQEVRLVGADTALPDQAPLVGADTALPDQAPLEPALTYVAATPAHLFSVALEDLLAHDEQPNLPSAGSADTPESHPNWRQVLSPSVENLLADEEVVRRMKTIDRARNASESRGRSES